MKILQAAAFLFAGLLTACGAEKTAPPSAYQPQEGDIFFQSFPHNELTDTIEGVTQSPRSHCGILRKHGEGWVIMEAIQPVCETPLADWVRRGRDGKYEVFRLKEPFREKIPGMIAAAQTYLGRPYDIRYRFDDEQIYCSELVFKSFRDAGGGALGRVQALGDLNWKPHAAYIRKLEGGGLPLERKMITPRAVSEAEQLELVYSGK
jgi:hypothetical protein